MAISFWTNDFVWNIANVILIGWLALILVPFNKLCKYFVLIPALFLSIIYTGIFVQNFLFIQSTISTWNYFHLSTWLMLIKNTSLVVGMSNHLRLVDLWLAYWMVKDFYSNHTFAYSVTMHVDGTIDVKKSWTIGRMVFTFILLLTYLAAPLGFLVYHLMKLTILFKHRASERIDFRNGHTFNLNSHRNQLQSQSLIHRPVRFGDRLPQPFQTIYHILLGIYGLLILFTIALPAYFLLRIYCRIKYRSPSYKTSSLQPNKSIPESVRNMTAEMKLTSLTTPLNQRKFLWHVKYILLQISNFAEYIPNASNPVVLFQALDDYFRGVYNLRYFVFGDGIAVNSYELVKRYLQDLPPRKGFEFFGWPVSSSQGTFCDFTTIFLSSDNPEMKLGRDIVFQWLHAFPHDLQKETAEVRYHLSRLVPRRIDQQPDENTVYQAVGEVMFYLATNGELRKHERQAFLDCVKNPFIFFPNWFNFLLAGHYFERKTLNSYYVLLQAFSRYADGSALRAAFKAAENRKSQLEVLRLISLVFSVAGSAAPAKLAYAVIQKLWSNKEQNVPLFKKNPHNFIKECARLDKVVPMVNVLATDEIIEEIQADFQKNNRPIRIPKDTPIHCSIVNANRDPNVFENPDQFLPERLDLNKMIVWNGVEEDIMKHDKNKRPLRYCPGHDLSLNVIQYVVKQFLPVIFEETIKPAPQPTNCDQIGRREDC